ncbi:DNA-formamidopyrimidine glycosylase [Streptococcus ruminantium]|uniref:Formamidopyrimidine-DNA glycosylase n=1 Tax=Streptococcus ruminantium TaxID=1917441 RepID=A0ABU1B5D0_9STRE|nr:DNA-formamidopyrimidine glycosylase [Streptococcus ruminantium]MDQ8760116.1 DNA-formamidopyrimidine glycosylase [Streptococcus ruminantium]MDQ8769438.1 DNA-formamidopyrimidine glycosylase [Streptococcus ruminantium]MDQ8775395.1 DNA-formamidopyrimidine glycosylase [Streptococcus ruminantium]MDQ8794915.1 DNA-formamidopyrimidine glycosylase [Streptococcus ruminantium]MDQ8796749.1 DNA-formamidopyrimidine glycosylase [Streptococcus ruminantium]
MPELPEVETVRRGLNRLVKGKTIQKVEVIYAPMVKTGVDRFCQDLVGQVIMDVQRRGKYLLIYLTDFVLISHLRMEGKYNFFPKQVPTNKHFHAFFTFTDDSTLVYQDVRKFGTMELLQEKNLSAYFASRKIGPEPTEEDFHLAEFTAKLARSKKPIKSHLLDQSLVAGLGNIYADEVLFRAQVHPAQVSHSLSANQITALRQATIEVLQLGIEKGGSTIRTYKNALGMDGSMQDYLQVYGKTGQACPCCQEKIVKIQLGGRGTHFCPRCQVLDG